MHDDGHSEEEHMAADQIETINKLLVETEAAHGAFETTELNGVFDQDWPRWYAAYAVEHGLGDHLGHEVSRDQVADFLVTSYAAFENADEKASEPWTAFVARRLVEQL
jgi:hypothetical protein